MAVNQAEQRSSSSPGCWHRCRKGTSYYIRRIANRLLAGLLLMGLFVLSMGSSVQAAEAEYIRVGLKSAYEKVSQIRIGNAALSFGYCVKDIFYPEETLYSESGFQIQPESGSWSVYQGTYGSYAAAVKDAALIRSTYGVAVAYPASVGKGSWRIYIPTSAVRDSYQYGSGSGIYGLFEDSADLWLGYTDLFGTGQKTLAEKLSSMTRSSAHMLFVRTQTGGFLIDAEMAGSYPQFAPVAESKGKVPVIRLNASAGNGTTGDGSEAGTSNTYRGRMEIGRYGNSGVTAVNVLPLEEYLYGVVASEMPYTWPMEALKAQAVCARGYALLTAGVGSSGSLTGGYRISDTTLHQAYRGYGAEQKTTTRAVDLTRGETVCYENRVVKTYYFSTSGGSTEAVEDVWGGNLSYLQSVTDLYEDEPAKKPWLVTMTKAEILSRVQSKEGKQIGSIVSIKPEIKTQSGRVYALRIEGTKDSITLDQGQIRSLLGLYSTKFRVIAYGEQPDKVYVQGADGGKNRRISQSYVISGSKRTERMDTSLEQYVVLSAGNRTGFAQEGPAGKSSYVFAGSGYGHGVGMSQSGARGMAEEGYNYKEILAHYFTGTTVQ